MGLKRFKQVGQRCQTGKVVTPDSISPTIDGGRIDHTPCIVVPEKTAKKRSRVKKLGDLRGKPDQMGDRVYDVAGIAPTLASHRGNRSKGSLLVSGQMTTTNTPVESTGNTTEKSTKETSKQLTLVPYQTTISSVRDFLANLSLLLESGEASRILEAHSSLRYAESYGLKDLECFSLRMSADSSPMMKAEPFSPSYSHWMNWGMMCNGLCSTARISESHSTGKECSLLDILEEHVDPKYFLSEKATQGLWKNERRMRDKKILRGHCEDATTKTEQTS